VAGLLMPRLRYYEFTTYSPVLDCEVARISLYDERGGEFFMIVPTGRGYRAARSKALAVMCEAIDDGVDPGEVRLQ
jgi:hypothetical protein